MRRIAKDNINTPEYTDSLVSAMSIDFEDEERLKGLAKDYNGGVFVDVGCFDSQLAPYIKRQHPYENVVAIDHSKKVIEIMGNMFPYVQFICADAYKLPFKDNEVSYLVAGELMEHLEYPHLFLTEAMRVVKKRGTIAISVPFDEGGEGSWVNKEEHLWSFTKDDLEELLPKCETDIIENRLVAWYEN